MKRAARFKTGSVVFDKRRKSWNFLWWENGRRRSKLIGSLEQCPTKSVAQGAAQPFRQQLESHNPTSETHTVKALVARYEAERLPSRFSTARVYKSWLNNYVLPNWGDKLISQVQPRPVELWLRELDLSPKSKAHVRNMLHLLMDFAMWSGVAEVARNPIDLVVVKGATKRTRQPRSLTVEEFQKLRGHLKEPFGTMALVCVCFGLRISECLALRWSDVDWLNGKLRIERGIVAQKVDEVKTDSSRKSLTVAKELLDALRVWRQAAEFASEEDWIFASPLKIGNLPYSYTGFWRELQRAAIAAGIGKMGTHTFRHTYRTWLDSVGTPVGIQQRLMRHSDIRTTMNQYGDAMTEDMREANEKVVRLALRSV
jgi:integrase